MLQGAGITTLAQVAEMNDADYAAVGVCLADKLQLKAMLRRENQSHAASTGAFRAFAGGDIGQDDLPLAPRSVDQRERFMLPQYILDPDFIRGWKDFFVDVQLRRGGYTARDREDVDTLLKILEDIRSQIQAFPATAASSDHVIQHTVERLLAHAVRLSGKSLEQWERTLANEKLRVRQGTRKYIDYPALYRGCKEEDKRFFRRRDFSRNNPNRSRSRSQGPQGQQQGAQQTCRICGQRFTGSWFAHRPSCRGSEPPSPRDD